MSSDKASMAPEIDGAMYGIKRFSYSKEWNFKPYNQPRNTCNQLRVNSDFYVYREASHGFDGIYAVYCESGLLSPGDAYHSSRRYTEGPFQYGFENAIQILNPETGQPFDSGVNWVKSSPSTVNQVHDRQDMTVTSVDDTISIGVGASASAQGPGGGVNLGYSHSESFQLWKSDSYSIKDWGVEERTEPVSNTGRWFWHQQAPYDITNLGSDDFSWWQQAYESDWPPSLCKETAMLSRSTMQYNTAIAWRFDLSLVKKGTLPVRFVQSLNWKCALIAQPDWAPTEGHHQIWSETFKSSATYDLDLAAIIRGSVIRPDTPAAQLTHDISEQVQAVTGPAAVQRRPALVEPN
ncbi:hypothetical protein HEQ60_05875 [Haematospirillum sp. H1815]|uniref:hypothetical protein n=1 Tax=Haematospirillum sp. H1815 TaxID=2723108 RepID=UPI00143C8D85|nr:hypothetical protein [Haematospirillum sp. H1815]NKD77288.1 hypothetical protein [Haematospirillum sp. H1815]